MMMNGKREFKKIFLEHWDDFKRNHPGYDDEYYQEIVEKMLGCGDARNGYTEYRCITCGSGSQRIPFTCKSSFCLSCGKVYSDAAVSQVSKMLHPGVRYRHVVLTVPEQLRQVFYKNRKSRRLYAALMRAGYECLEDLVRVVRKQSVKIGAIVVLHTHGRSGSYNPHVHIIVTDGGINQEEKRWIDLDYFPYEILHKKWQYYLLNMLKDQLGESVEEHVDILWRSYPEGFVGHVSKGKAPEYSQGLAKYLAKYVASPPISSRRLIKYDGDTVTYRYKDHKTKQNKVETIAIDSFIGRMVQHVLPKGFQRIRYYGLQATKVFSQWCDVIKEGLKKVGKVVQGSYHIIALKNYRMRHIETIGRDPLSCSQCQCVLTLWKIWCPKYGLLYDLIGSG